MEPIEISREEVLGRWNNIQNQPLHLYIHSPFCVTHCNYCVYRGTTEINKYDYDNYYYNYLPSRIDFYKPIIERNNVKNIFFGGGTPSLMKPETLESIVDKLNNITKSDKKTIEIHPAHTTNEFLYRIVKLGFDRVIVGVQTLDKNLIEKNNRKYASPERIKEIVDILKESGIEIWVDILTLLTENKNFEILKKDLEFAIEQDVDEITLAPIFANKSKEKWIEIVEFLLSLDLKGYKLEEKYYYSDDLKEIAKEKYKVKVIRLYKTEKNYNMNMYDLDGENVLGIGEFKNKDVSTISLISDKFMYYEKNVNNVPYYFKTYDNYENRIQDLIKYFNDKIFDLDIQLDFSFTLKKQQSRIGENDLFRNYLDIFIGHKRNEKCIRDIETIKNRFAGDEFINIVN